MAMCRKDYEATALVMQRMCEALRLYHGKTMNYISAQMIWADAIRGMGDVFAADNRNFDRNKFYKACSKLTEEEYTLKQFEETKSDW